MDLDPRNPLLSFTYFCQGKSAEELRQMIICVNIELQRVRVQAEEEIRKRDDELRRYRDILSKAVKERDEAQDNVQRLLMEKLSQHNWQQQELKQVAAAAAPVSGVTSIEDEVKRGSSSEGDESIVSSPLVDPLPPPPPLEAQLMMTRSMSYHEEMMELLLLENRPLPEKGKLLDAVMSAGPLLQTLLLAGPLPQWRHPPPPLESSTQIPPVAIPSPPLKPLHKRDTFQGIADYSSIGNDCGRLNRKRGLMEGASSFTKTKYHRVLLN